MKKEAKLAEQIEAKEIDFAAIEKKWQKEWEKAKIFEVKEDSKKKKYYVLEMFPYPSASFLHMGHLRNYSMGDVTARFRRMLGFNVLYPMGYDSFGLPAENAAKKAGTHPRIYTENAIEKIMEYQKQLGLSYDWSRMIATHTPEYYRWNQLIFEKLLEKGLAYRSKARINWCPKCNTVLANEEVVAGKCWRCDSEVSEKEMDQWFFKITEYAEEILNGIDNLQWSDQLKLLQKNWIGKSTGIAIDFTIDGKIWPVFTTRPDTIYGVTFVVISAQHSRLKELVKGTSQEKEVLKFSEKCKIAKSRDEMDDLAKEGVFTGKYAVNPLTNEKVPVWAGNFVLAEYGSGMVMAVPAHDQRDFEFAKKYQLPIKVVIQPKDRKLSELKEAYVYEGILTNSNKFDGTNSAEAIEKISDFIEKQKLGKRKVNYKIRDWLISRQRYWGTPIPIIYCDKCGVVPVPEKDLPVLLPEDVKFSEKGNPIMTSKKFQDVKCPKCKGEARRETDTMGGFMDSSWYFLRYCDSKNSKQPFGKKSAEYWMPVDQYIGGIEHAVGHLIYARFFTKVFRDMGLLKFDEPFTKLFNQGIVYKDGKRMSKSQGNTITPDDVSAKYGIDSARLFLLFVAAPESNMEWTDDGMEGIFRFVKKVISLKDRKFIKDSERLGHFTNKAIKEVTADIENFKFNIAIIKLMAFADALEKEISKDSYETLLKMLSPFAPHICEELWHNIGNKTFISTADWPKCDEKKINPEIERLEKAAGQLGSDIRNVLKIINKVPKRICVYAIPKELSIYDAKALEHEFSCQIDIFAVNDPKKYDPQNKAGKAKLGKPAIYIE